METGAKSWLWPFSLHQSVWPQSCQDQLPPRWKLSINLVPVTRKTDWLLSVELLRVALCRDPPVQRSGQLLLQLLLLQHAGARPCLLLLSLHGSAGLLGCFPHPGLHASGAKTPGSGDHEDRRLGLQGASLQTEGTAKPETVPQFAPTRGSRDAKLQLCRLKRLSWKPGFTGEGIICQHDSCYCLQPGLIRPC